MDCFANSKIGIEIFFNFSQKMFNSSNFNNWVDILNENNFPE